MKKITSFLMVLFVALGAMAQTTTTYDFEDGNALFVGRSRITVGVEDGLGYDGTKAVHFTCAHNAQNGYSFADFDISSLVGNPKTVTISLQYYNTQEGRAILSIGDASVRGTTGNSSKTTYSNKGAIFALGSEKSNAFLNGSKPALSSYCNKWLDVSVTVDVINKKHSYTIKESASGTVLASAEGVDYYSSDALECTQIDLFGYINNNKCAYIDNLTITVEQDVRAYADYTVKYVDESGTAIKDAAVYNGAVGDAISLVEADKISFKNNDNTKKYIYKSDDANGKTIAEDGSTVVTVVFREAVTYSYTANAVDGEGNVLKALAPGSNFEGETATVFYNRYILKDGVLYEKAAVSNQYSSAFALSTDGLSFDIVYGKSATTNAVYFSEAEDIESVTPYEDGYTNIRMSNGAAAYATELTTITSLPAGVYTLTSATRAGSTTFYAGSSDVLTMSSTGSVETPTSEEFTLYEPTEIKVSAGNNKNYFDYVLICRVGDAPIRELVVAEGEDFAPEYDAYSSATYTRSIAEGVYGTICLPFAPDAASLENYTFFKMESAGADAINFVEETAPQANTPYIYCLKGENVAITGGATVVSADINSVEVGNWTMKGSFTKQTIATAGADTKFYGYVADQNKIVKANKTLTVLPYRAYFTAPVNAAAVALRITRGDETTEITTADLDVQPATVIYDLAGRRVEKIEKGIYIVNGKKVIR